MLNYSQLVNIFSIFLVSTIKIVTFADDNVGTRSVAIRGEGPMRSKIALSRRTHAQKQIIKSYRQMKQIFRLLLLVLMVVFPSSMKAQSQLRLELNDGTSAVCLLAEKPVILFSGTKLVLKVGEQKSQFEIEEVKKFFFEIVGTGINPVENAEAVRYDYTDGRNLRISGATGVAAVQLYDVAGKVVATQQVDNGAASVNLQTLPAGVYVLKVGAQSMKISKK